jgi:hypothetical protein
MLSGLNQWEVVPRPAGFEHHSGFNLLVYPFGPAPALQLTQNTQHIGPRFRRVVQQGVLPYQTDRQVQVYVCAGLEAGQRQTVVSFQNQGLDPVGLIPDPNDLQFQSVQWSGSSLV